MKYKVTILFLLFASMSHVCAEESTQQTDIEKYKKNYAQQLIPLLKDRMGIELEIQSEADAQEHVTTLANRMASCQLVAIESYPQKYQDASVIPVANGASLKQANADLNQIIQTDIQNGDITDQELETMTGDAIEKYKACLSDAEPNTDNLPQ